MKTLVFTFLCSLFSFYSFAQVASYSFNNGNANDEVGSNDGTVYGATPTTDRFGNPNHAYFFDGVDDYIDLGDDPAFQMGSNNFSISLWIKTDSIIPKACILGKINTGQLVASNYNQYSIWYNNTTGLINTNCRDDASGFAITGSDAIDTSGWNHIVLLHGLESTSGVYGSILYINNVAVDTAVLGTSSGDFDIPNVNLAIGRRDATGDFYFKGIVDDVHIYQNSLSLQQIDSLYNAPNPSPVTSSILETEKEQVAQIFPNPSSGILNIQHPTEAFNRVEVISIDGRSQFFNLATSKQQQLDLSDLQAGLYSIRLWAEDKVIAIQKFSKF